MAQREGSIYLYLFIVACVLFMIMSVLFFMENSAKEQILVERAQLEQTKKSLDGDKRQLNDTISGLRLLIAGPGAATGEWPREPHYMDLMKEKAERAINEVLAELKQPLRTYDSLIACYGDIQALFKSLLEERQAAFVKREAALGSEVKARTTHEESIAEHKRTVDQTLVQLQELQARYEDLDGRSKAEKAELVKKLESIQDDRTREVTDLMRQLAFKDTQIKALDSRVDKLLAEVNKEKTEEDVAEDGKIVNFLSSSGKGWINLGRGDHLPNGLVFRVFQYSKGGKKHYKGQVEVQKVGDDISEVRVLEEKDSLNPIVAGDFITSAFYDPNAKQIFVFAGSEMESKDVTKDYVVAKMKSYGATVSEKVDIDTDFLVAFKNYENTPEYKAARELGVTVIRERDLLEYIGR